MTVEKKKRPRDRAEGVEPVDDHIGHRLTMARKMRGYSREGLAAALGDISSQQLMKIELGKNRVFANRLWAIARVLNLPLGWFFEGFMTSQSAASMAAGAAGVEANELMGRLTPANINLLENYDRLSTTQQRLIRQIIAEFVTPTADDDTDEGMADVGGEARFSRA